MSAPTPWLDEVNTMACRLAEIERETGMGLHVGASGVSIFTYDGVIPDLGREPHHRHDAGDHTVIGYYSPCVTVFAHPGPDPAKGGCDAF